jgi:hypothetical protein
VDDIDLPEAATRWFHLSRQVVVEVLLKTWVCCIPFYSGLWA